MTRARPMCAQGGPTRARVAALGRHLEQAGIDVGPERVMAASRTAFWLTLASLAALATAVLSLAGTKYAFAAGFAALMCALIARELVLAYPRAAAQKRAWAVLRSSTEGVNMMIVGLRHEPSLPSAMRSAASLASEFGYEVRAAIWGVVMGVHSTFEDAMIDLGARWGEHSRDLKAAVQSLITASCEGSEDGRRNALDRASNSLVASTRRRIEDYALGLALPSTMLFSIGVLLPLMVGSFLPMMSWDVWTTMDPGSATGPTSMPDPAILRTVLVMNVMFPAIALVIAMDAVSRHPMTSLARRGHDGRAGVRAAALACAVAAGCLGLVGSSALTTPSERSLGVILSVVVPVACYLMFIGENGGRHGEATEAVHAEDTLFRLGARLVEGENLECAARGALGGQALASVSGGFGASTQPGATDASGVEALRVVVRAAAKDEAQAGMLAMDLSRYVRDISELDLTLRRRLRPTVSMMRLTSHALAPLMLGITYAIYLSLASIGGEGTLHPGALLFVLGAFLVEMNAVVVYFVWGIGERRSYGELQHSVGSCVLVATLVYSATVLVVS